MTPVYDKLRVGIVGQRGTTFAASLQALPHVQLTALCDTNEAVLPPLQAKYNVPHTFTRFVDMLEVVDAVIVATPMQLHVGQSVLALRAGKHVLSEVIAAVSLHECWRLLDAVQESGRVYMMAENYCYFQDNVLVREMARKGLFGEPYFAEGEYLHEVRALHHAPDGSPTWRYYYQVGNRGSTYATHSIGPAMQWFQAVHPDERIASVLCVGTGVHTDPEHPHDDTTLLMCQLRSGKLLKVRLDMMSNRPHQVYYSLQGTHGVYEASRTGGRGYLWLGESRPDDKRAWRSLAHGDFDEHLPAEWREATEQIRQSGHGGGDWFVVRDWVRAIQTNTPPPIDIYTALEWTAAGLCSQISIENGGVPIRLPDFRNRAGRPVLLDAPPVIE